ncbi:MAG: hypothetical protein QM586_15355 [Xenophilus sp.]
MQRRRVGALAHQTPAADEITPAGQFVHGVAKQGELRFQAGDDLVALGRSVDNPSLFEVSLICDCPARQRGFAFVGGLHYTATDWLDARLAFAAALAFCTVRATFPAASTSASLANFSQKSLTSAARQRVQRGARITGSGARPSATFSYHQDGDISPMAAQLFALRS